MIRIVIDFFSFFENVMEHNETNIFSITRRISQPREAIFEGVGMTMLRALLCKLKIVAISLWLIVIPTALN